MQSRRGYYDAEGWHDGPALNGAAQWHSATCEGPQAQVMYGRERAMTLAPKHAENFPFDTIPSLEERAMRFGLAMRDWVATPTDEILRRTR